MGFVFVLGSVHGKTFSGLNGFTNNQVLLVNYSQWSLPQRMQVRCGCCCNWRPPIDLSVWLSSSDWTVLQSGTALQGQARAGQARPGQARPGQQPVVVVAAVQCQARQTDLESQTWQGGREGGAPRYCTGPHHRSRHKYRMQAAGPSRASQPVCISALGLALHNVSKADK